ncbi:uncharacterized protein TNCV_1542041 [Trichonephila clavipes]|nr:uncharacterized protein TNCV_1542041 [Trichonephila clavipes]
MLVQLSFLLGPLVFAPKIGSRSETLLNTYNAIIRPILEYTALIWAPSASTSTEKIDSVQYRTSKIIIGAVFSTNNVTAENECGLPSLKGRRKLVTIIFTNKIRSNISPTSLFAPGCLRIG